MLLIRPLLRANAVRQRKAHVIVFFIFIVEQRRRPAHAARRSAALPRLPAGRALRLDAAALAAVAVRERRCCSSSSTSSTRPSSAHEDLAHARRPRRDRRRAPACRCASPASATSSSSRGIVLVHPGLRGYAAACPSASRRAACSLMAVLSWFTTPKALRQENDFSWTPDRRGGGALRRHLRHHDPGARDPQRPRRRARAHGALAVLLGLGRALLLPRQRADLPHLRRGRERPRSAPTPPTSASSSPRAEGAAPARGHLAAARCSWAPTPTSATARTSWSRPSPSRAA